MELAPGAALRLQATPSGMSIVSGALPGPRPGPPPASLGSNGVWAGHATPVQQLAAFQQGEPGRLV